MNECCFEMIRYHNWLNTKVLQTILLLSVSVAGTVSLLRKVVEPRAVFLTFAFWEFHILWKKRKKSNIYFLPKIERINYSNSLFQLALTKARAKQQFLVCLYNSPLVTLFSVENKIKGEEIKILFALNASKCFKQSLQFSLCISFN